jgi:hypothetical protein
MFGTSMKKIIINSKKHGKHTVLVDNEDYPIVSKIKWTLKKHHHKKIYVHFGIDKTTITLHRMVMGFPKRRQIDHIDFNGLNNQKNNLRLCINEQNARHRRKPKNNTSGYKGVTTPKNSKKYKATIVFNYKSIYLGYFNTAIEAAKAYNTAALKYFGEFAKLNTL